MANDLIKFPETLNERNIEKANFMHNWNFPGVMGAIDCMHIAILKPVDQEHNFINRNGFHSLNVQMTCSHDQKITSVNSMYGGSTHP